MTFCISGQGDQKFATVGAFSCARSRVPVRLKPHLPRIFEIIQCPTHLREFLQVAAGFFNRCSTRNVQSESSLKDNVSWGLGMPGREPLGITFWAALDAQLWPPLLKVSLLSARQAFVCPEAMGNGRHGRRHDPD